MRRIAVMILMILISGSCRAMCEEFTVAAKAAVVIDAKTGRVLYSQNSDEMLPMASTTKLMTCLLAVENGNMNDIVAVPKEASGVPGTSIYLSEGEKLTLEQLLYGLMLRSGNDAAVAIAIHVGGSKQSFVDMMNVRANEMHVDAHFENPHGLDADGHSASALALVQIMREAMKHEEFRQITSAQRKVIPWDGNDYSRVLYNKNRLLKSYDGTVGGKTGYTSKAGRCLVFAAEKNGMTLIGCVLNCSTWFDTAERLLDYCFESYIYECALEAGEIADEVRVTGGTLDTVDVIVGEKLVFPIGPDEEYVLATEIWPAEAPVKAGVSAGCARVIIDGEIAAEAELVYAFDVPENGFNNALRRIIDRWPAYAY